MVIELKWCRGGIVPVPLINGLYLHHHLSAYLAMRYYQPRWIRANMAPVTGGSLRQIAYDLKAVLEALANSQIEFTEATYDAIQEILETQLGDANPHTYNVRHTRVRDFFNYLQKVGVRTRVRFPARTIRIRYGNKEDYFLSHISSHHGESYEKDDGHKRTTRNDDYKDRVISIQTYGRLYRALHKIDPVYAVIAQTMMQTFLRVADICEMPLHKNRFNRYLPLWPEFERSDKDVLKYVCMTKRSKRITIDIFPETIRSIYADYILPYYHDRRNLFESRYMKRRNATLEFGNLRDAKRRSCPDDILWLTATGAPVKPYMIEMAFRQTGLDVDPHMLRHSGATHTLWNYCQLNGIEPDTRMAGAFHEVLRDQLGHADLELTRRYVRTIMKLKGRMTMPFAIPGNKSEIDRHLPGRVREIIDNQMAHFFRYRAEGVASPQNLSVRE